MCVYVIICVCVCVFMCMYSYTYVCVFMCVYVCIYIYIYIYVRLTYSLVALPSPERRGQRLRVLAEADTHHRRLGSSTSHDVVFVLVVGI